MPPPPAQTASTSQSSGGPSSVKAGGFEISDVWHPVRAVRKGMDWAGDQLPDLGSDKPATEVHAKAPAPISLVPSGAFADAPAQTKPNKPGPGSGGLY